tara:strand:- start:1433 stop:1588 length:156 start_codon:yes stop_codon:yes gene_type:complete
MARPGISWAGFFMYTSAVGINKIRKLHASYLVLKVDRILSDVISTLRTRII